MHQCVCIYVYLVELDTHTHTHAYVYGSPEENLGCVTIGTSYFQAQSLTDILAYAYKYYTHSKKTKEKYQHYSTLQNKTEKGYSIKQFQLVNVKGMR